MIRVSEPFVPPESEALVSECVRSGWISSAGTFVDRFETEWAAYCGAEHGVAVSSGTAALHVAMEALDLAPGDEVVMPSFTIISCATAILAAGAVPVLVDSDPATWCMDLDEVEAKLSPRTRAVMPVHAFGHPVDLRRLRGITDRHDLVIVEDAAEAHGAEVNGERVGGLGDLGCFSFYANKIVTTGEGGMVVTDDARFADRMRSLRNLCFGAEQRFRHERLGNNYRITNLQAALGVAQLPHIEANITRKRRITAAYNRLLGDVPGLTLPIEKSWARSVYWMYGIVLDDGLPLDGDDLAARLRARGVDTRPLFLGMHEQPALLKRGLFAGERYPVAERLARRGLYLPSGLTITEDEIETVARAVADIVSEVSR